MNSQQQRQQQPKAVNVNILSEKCKSKKELYHFLTLDGEAFLPRIQSTNIYFFKQIINGRKNYIKRDQVKVSAIPHIEGLTVEDFLSYAKQNNELLTFLPDERDWVHMDRQWICDVLYTLDQEGISLMVKNALQQRKEKLEQNRNLLVEMKPEFIEALNNCLSFSRILTYYILEFIIDERGRSSNLLKETAKRKRIRSELEEVKNEEDELKADKQKFLQQVKRLKLEKEVLEKQIIELNQANQELAQLFENENLNQNAIQFQI